MFRKNGSSRPPGVERHAKTTSAQSIRASRGLRASAAADRQSEAASPGLLNGYNYKTTGFDKHLLAFLKVDPDAFEEAAHRLEDDISILAWVRENGANHSAEEIEQWNQAMISRHPDTAAKKARFAHFLKEAGGQGRKDIRTYFDLILFDEGRLK